MDARVSLCPRAPSPASTSSGRSVVSTSGLFPARSTFARDAPAWKKPRRRSKSSTAWRSSRMVKPSGRGSLLLSRARRACPTAAWPCGPRHRSGRQWRAAPRRARNRIRSRRFLGRTQSRARRQGADPLLRRGGVAAPAPGEPGRRGEGAVNGRVHAARAVTALR